MAHPMDATIPSQSLAVPNPADTNPNGLFGVSWTTVLIIVFASILSLKNPLSTPREYD
jgi:hypothetical protein